MDLQIEFLNIWNALGCRGNCGAEWEERRRLYAQPGRYYHTLAHIGHVLRELMPLTQRMEHPDETLWAAMDHDVVLVPVIDGVPVTTNEKESAMLSMKTLASSGVPHPVQVRVGLQILATDHKHQIMNRDTKYLVDADMAILGQPWPTYLKYCIGVRSEYLVCGVSIEAFNAGRLAFLTKLQDSRIYHTDHFSRIYEEPARENIKREIQLLGETA